MRKKFKLISDHGDLVERNENEVMLVPVVGSGTVRIGRESGVMRSFFAVMFQESDFSRYEDDFNLIYFLEAFYNFFYLQCDLRRLP
jgi:hypothetical protein